ncbi:hypothetical protein KZ813_10565 [Sphingomonas sp. RHCKR7]|uniref:hypothetical protein n=1 Tax=Sphingomonas folli TaxID=2862497 RepID=UPI001CA50698|nr:hypothetical protein [Sphingomonas folli]MBW6527282.1 hypothetical protein [Sphingomonas folli]
MPLPRLARLAAVPLVLAAALLLWLGARVTPGAARDEAVTVVAAPDARVTSPPTRPVAPSPSVAAPAVAPAAVAARVARAFPLLGDVAVSCAGDACALTATVRPAHGQRELDERQAMLLGGLADTVAVSGYTMRVPFAFDEVDDNVFHLRAALTRTR